MQQTTLPQLLYIVGGGPGMADRVDVSDLFAKRLAGKGFAIDWVMHGSEPGPAWEETRWHGARAYVVGKSRQHGLVGSVVNKLRDLWGDLRTTATILRRRYDIVIVRDKFLVGVLAMTAVHLRGGKFAYWASYPFAECRILDAREGRARLPWFSLAYGKVATWMLYRLILPRADKVFVQSQQMLQDFRAEGIDDAKMVPVPMGINEAQLEHPGCDVIPDTALYLGTLNLVRRLDTLVDAIAIVRARFPAARLTFVGDGDVPEDRKRLEDAIARHGLEDAVEITGWLPVTEAHARVCSAAVCLSPFYPTPILLSTSPTKLIEYMALQRPVVANEHPEQSLIIAESEAGICVPWSAQAFADAICTLFADPGAAEAMAVRGRAYVRDKRLYSLIAARVGDELLDLAGRTPVAAGAR